MLLGRTEKVYGRLCYHQLLWSVDKRIIILPGSHWRTPVHVQQVSSKSAAQACVCCPRQHNLWPSLATWPPTSVKQAKEERTIWQPYGLCSGAENDEVLFAHSKFESESESKVLKSLCELGNVVVVSRTRVYFVIPTVTADKVVLVSGTLLFVCFY